MAKKMTESQAWWRAGVACSRSRPAKGCAVYTKGVPLFRIGRNVTYCLCGIIIEMRKQGMIESVTEAAMGAAIALQKKHSRNWPYGWPLTLSGAAKRAAFCRRMARATSK